MSAHQLWRSGRLAEAVESQTSEVRSHPADPERRYFLFALLAFLGDLERAARQLDALGVGDEKLAASSKIYRNLLISEAERRRSFAGESRPVVPPDAPESLGLRVQAMGAAAAGDAAGCAQLLQRAGEAESAVRGTCNEVGFESVADTDELLGPSLEVFAAGRYVLVPIARLVRLEIPEPKHVLDLLWTPARVLDVEGTEADVHLPVLYEGSYAAGSEPIRMGRGTEWYESGGAVRGRGQKVWTLSGADGESERSLLEIRQLSVAATTDARG